MLCCILLAVCAKAMVGERRDEAKNVTRHTDVGLSLHADGCGPEFVQAGSGVGPNDMKDSVRRGGQAAVVAASPEGRSRIEGSLILRCVWTGGSARHSNLWQERFPAIE